jgi:hypothetical protein
MARAGTPRAPVTGPQAQPGLGSGVPVPRGPVVPLGPAAGTAPAQAARTPVVPTEDEATDA